MKSTLNKIIFVFVCFTLTHPLVSRADYATERVAKGLKVSWAFTWLPGGDLLVTQRRGKLLRIRDGEVIAEITGVPEVKAKGQGGLLDVALHPEFKTNQLVYLSFSDPSGSGANTSIARGRLQDNELSNLQLLYKADPSAKGNNHYGGRMVFDKSGYLYFSIGDRGKRDINPQDSNRDGGKVYRIYEDGKLPEDNPFAVDTRNGLPAIYSLGHRNIQGMALHPQTGKVWTHEHGPRGGDEVNLIEAGANYGWPILSYGKNYSGTSFAEGTEREGYQSPLWYWVPSIAPSGMAFVTSDKYPEWKGHLLVGSLKFGQLVLCRIEGDKVVSAKAVVEDLGRVRDVRQGPDGYIYVAIDGGGIHRIIPEPPFVLEGWLDSVFSS